MAIMILSSDIEAVDVEDIPMPRDHRPKRKDEDDHEKVIVDPVKQAFDDLVEKVSVAGWKEAFGERIPWISHSFKVVLLIFSGFCLYYIHQVIFHWARSGETDEIQEIGDVDAPPMSNVTVCAQVYANETFIRHNVTIPPYVLSKLRNGTDRSVMDEFYTKLALFLSPMTRPRPFNTTLLTYFGKAVRANPQLHHFAAYNLLTQPACRNMFKRCWFDGIEFDCCTKAVRSIDDDGVCYLFHLNFDSDNAVPSPETLLQTRPGPSGGFSVEASLAVDDFPWLDDDAGNGFRVVVGPVPYSNLQTVLAVPDRSETFIKTTPSKRVLSTNCAPRGQMSMPGGAYAYYDPEGLSCTMRSTMKVIRKYAGYLYQPNSNVSCEPLATYKITAFNFDRDFASTYGQEGGSGSKAIVSSSWVNDVETYSRAPGDTRCPTHCQYWTYDSTANFFYLDNPMENDAINKYMYSKIHVYYADFGYRQHERVKEVTSYTVFGDFANLVGLYIGVCP